MLKKICFSLFAIFLVFMITPSAKASASPDLTVTYSIGLEGKAKYGKGAPLTLTVENKGDDFVGDLVLDISHSYTMGSGEVIPLAIAKGESKSVSINISRMDDTSNIQTLTPMKSIHFYEGGWRKGKEISHKGPQAITSTLFYEDSKFIVTFSSNADRLRALTKASVLNSRKIQFINAVKMGNAKLPDSSTGWGAADFIISDEYPIADIPKKKQEALLDWVREGGIFIVGASDTSEAEAGIFSSYLPLQLKGVSTIDSSILNSWIGDEGFAGTIPSFATEAQKDSVPILWDGENIIVSSTEVGKGLIIQTSFSLGDDPLIKMDGITPLWNRILEEGNEIQQRVLVTQQKTGNTDSMDALVYTLGSSNEIFPSFKVSTPLIFGIIMLYMVIILPVLYFILKRKDKREFAWWIIPVIAVLTSVGIFAYGAKDRMGRVQVQHSAVVTVNADDSADGYFTESVLSNKSGEFSFKAPTSTTMSATVQNLLFNSSLTPIHESIISERDATGSTLHMRDVGFWNVATVYGEMKHEEVGHYEVDLKVENKKLTGTIKNNFPFGLKDVAIWSGTTLLPLGDIEQGAMITVDEILKTSALVPKQYMYNTMSINPTTEDRDNLDNMRMQSLLTFSGEQLSSGGEPAVIGYTDTQVIPIELDKLQPSLSSMTLVQQSIQAEVIFAGAITVEPEMMKSTLVAETAQMQPQPIGNINDQYYFEPGTYIQTWQLPANLMAEKLKWNKLAISRLNIQLYDAAILNVKTGLYEEAKADKIEVTTDVEQYLSPQGQLKIKLSFRNTQNVNEAKAPEIRLSGEVAK